LLPKTCGRAGRSLAAMLAADTLVTPRIKKNT
jgi:hypothetical protein